jgi:hypothetical protein
MFLMKIYPTFPSNIFILTYLLKRLYKIDLNI